MHHHTLPRCAALLLAAVALLTVLTVLTGCGFAGLTHEQVEAKIPYAKPVSAQEVRVTDLGGVTTVSEVRQYVDRFDEYSPAISSGRGSWGDVTTLYTFVFRDGKCTDYTWRDTNYVPSPSTGPAWAR